MGKKKKKKMKGTVEAVKIKINRDGSSVTEYSNGSILIKPNIRRV